MANKSHTENTEITDIKRPSQRDRSVVVFLILSVVLLLKLLLPHAYGSSSETCNSLGMC